jgi:hypothetical protein
LKEHRQARVDSDEEGDHFFIVYGDFMCLEVSRNKRKDKFVQETAEGRP